MGPFFSLARGRAGACRGPDAVSGEGAPEGGEAMISATGGKRRSF